MAVKAPTFEEIGAAPSFESIGATAVLDPAEEERQIKETVDISYDLGISIVDANSNYKQITDKPEKRPPSKAEFSFVAYTPSKWEKFKDFFISKREPLPPNADRIEKITRAFDIGIGAPLRVFMKFSKGMTLGAPDLMWAALKRITPDDMWVDEVKDMTLDEAMDWAGGYDPSGFQKSVGEIAEFVGRIKTVAPIAQKIGIIGNTPKDISILSKAGEAAKLFGIAAVGEQAAKFASAKIDPTEAEYGYEGPKAVLRDMAIGAAFSLLHSGVKGAWSRLTPSEHQRALKLLGVKEGATTNEIKAAARNMFRKYHPDKAKGFQTEFENVIKARDTLIKGEPQDIIFRGQKVVFKPKLLEGETVQQQAIRLTKKPPTEPAKAPEAPAKAITKAEPTITPVKAKRPWDMTDKEFKEGGWTEFPGGEEQKILLPSEYEQIAKNEGEQARDLVYELNLAGVDTLDTHKTDKGIVIHIPPKQLDTAQSFIDKYNATVRTSEAIGHYLTIPVEAKQPWEMTREEYTGKKPAEFTQEMSRYQAKYQQHGWAIEEAVEQGKPVPRAVLEEYKSEKWAQEALAKAGVEGEVEVAEELKAIKRANPMLFKRAQKATNVDEFIDSVVKADKTTRDNVSIPTLTDFYNKIKALEKQAAAPPAKAGVEGEVEYLQQWEESILKEIEEEGTYEKTGMKATTYYVPAGIKEKLKTLGKTPQEYAKDYVQQHKTEILEGYKKDLERKAKRKITPPAKAVKKPGEEPSGGVSWQQGMKSVLDLAEKDRPKIRQEQKKTLAERVGAQAGTLEFLRKKGVSGKEAIHKSAGKLKGALTNYEGRYQPLADIIQPQFIEAAENDMADTDRLTPLDKINMTNFDKSGAWDKMLRGAAMTPGDVKLIRKWQPILAEEAAKRVPLSSRVWEGLEWMLGTLKFGAAFDVQIRRQARWLRGRHPVLFTKAVGRDLAAYVSSKYADKMAAETVASPYHEQAQRYGLKFLKRQPLSSEQRPEQFVSNLPKTLPWLGKRIGTGYKYTGGQVGRVYAASMRGFIDSFNWMQQKMWDMQVEKWKGQNVEITQKMLNDLVDFQNTMLGMSKPKTNFGQAVNRVMRPVMWSPSLTWSRIRTPSLMLSNSTMRGEVAASLSTYIGTGLMYLGAASMLARWWNKEDPVEWDINSSDFGKIRIGDTRWDIYGDGGPYIRAILQAWAGTKKNQAGRVTTKEGFDKLDPFKQLLRNKRAPALDLFAKIWSGRNYYGGDAWALPDYDAMRKEGGTKEWFADWHEGQMEDEGKEVRFFIGKEVYDRYMPFFIQGALEAGWNDGWPQALGAGTDEFFSGQALSYKPSTASELQIVQDIAATQEYDKLWDNLTPKQQEKLYRQIPEMEQLEMKKASEKLPPEEISLTKQNRAAKRIFQAMPTDVKKEMNAVGVRISAPARKVGKFWLNESRYTAYEEYSRQEIEKQLSESISSGHYMRMDKIKRMRKLKDDIAKAKAEARKRLLREINRGDL